ncbi:hypothetical protein TIFTF001_009405 [Ficus carica]|uniref:Uncharacterized protein n=1 Tax=Ficus carica TaxID=3494 RepID=A0AA87ZUK8_FICCA|nr:hypothetical protein TIFTF001_009405 [Ficus carica]
MEESPRKASALFSEFPSPSRPSLRLRRRSDRSFAFSVVQTRHRSDPRGSGGLGFGAVGVRKGIDEVSLSLGKTRGNVGMICRVNGEHLGSPNSPQSGLVELGARYGGKASGGTGPPGGEELRDPHPRGVHRAPRLVCRRQHRRSRPSPTPIHVNVAHPCANPVAPPLTLKEMGFGTRREREREKRG